MIGCQVEQKGMWSWMLGIPGRTSVITYTFYNQSAFNITHDRKARVHTHIDIDNLETRTHQGEKRKTYGMTLGSSARPIVKSPRLFWNPQMP